jgi:SAM-dependent methyltransferase
VEKKNSFPQLLGVIVAAVGLLYSAAAHSLESEIDRLVQILQIKPGSIVADVGAGSGQISIAIAKQVGTQGRVYSTEINPKLVDQIRRLAESERVSNLVPVAGRPDNTELPSACCDAIFLRQVYHHLTDPLDMDHSLYQAMRPGARLAIIDFEPSQLQGRPAPPGGTEKSRWPWSSQKDRFRRINSRRIRVAESNAVADQSRHRTLLHPIPKTRVSASVNSTGPPRRACIATLPFWPDNIVAAKLRPWVPLEPDD